MFSLAQIEAALARRPKDGTPQDRQAAVSIILCETDGELDVLFIRRATHPDDPWSGQMAFPGGRAERGETMGETSVRETLEEVGLDLSRWARPLGRLQSVDTLPGLPPLTIFPFVYALDPSAPQPKPDAKEVDEVCWVPLTALLDLGERSPYRLTHRGAKLTVPSYDFEGRRIWGLSLRMIDGLRTRLLRGS